MIETVINDLVGRSDEEEWFDFKSNYIEPRILGEYISALSNVSAVFGK
jgi:ATP-dependent DNA helicase RecG